MNCTAVVLTCVAVVTAAAPHRALAQGAAPLALTRLSGDVVLDGVVNETAWLGIPPLPLTQYLPEPGGAVRQASEIRLAYDDRFVYASGRFTVAAGSSVRANSLVRDLYAEDDYLNLIIDTFDDRESAVWFVATPAGTRIDGAISNDAEGPEAQWNHPEYDMNWDAVSSRTAEGWSIEVRIPFSSLRFQPRDGVVTMGIIAARLISDGKERYIFPAIRPTRAVAHFKPSLAARVVLTDVRPDPLRSLASYVVLGSELQPPSDAEGAAAPERRTVRDLGADLKLGLSSRFMLDLSVNTDFAQAETDDQQVNLTRFSLFIPEKRQFFLERSGVFDFTTGGADRLFFSRRIGLDEAGRPTRVLGGGRVVGRVGPWDVGVLDLVTTDDRVSDAENSAVLRVRRSIGQAGSYMGAMATLVGRAPVHASRAAGIDGTMRISSDDYLVWSAAATSDTADAGTLGDHSVLRVAWERRRRIGFFAATSVTRIGERYDPALGFVRRPGTLTLGQVTRYAWPHEGGRIREQSIGLASTMVRHLATGRTESLSVEPQWSATAPNAAQATAFVRFGRELLADTFHIHHGLAVPPGTYRFVEAGATLATPPGTSARARVGVEGGRFYDGSRLSIRVSPVWNASARFEVAADVEGHRIWRAGQVFRGDLFRLRTRYSWDTRSSLSALMQYSRAAGLLTSSLRFRRSWGEGTDLYVVVNEGRTSERRNALGLPSAAQTQYVVLKYVHTLR